MNDALGQLAMQVELDAQSNEHMRLAFGQACAMRVKHLLEEQAAMDCLSILGSYLDGTSDHEELQRHAEVARRLANQHQGSRSMDGCGHAAVSATYAVANALAGKALVAAQYAAYATVYGEGGYGAVADPASFESEFRWQVDTLSSLLASRPQDSHRPDK